MNYMEGFFNHMNPAVITSVLSKMNEQEFEESTAFIKQKAMDMPQGTKRQMYLRLFIWCEAHRKENYKQKGPSLF